MKSQEIRKSKENLQNIINVLDKILAGKITQSEAAAMMGFSPQDFGRYVNISFSPYIKKKNILTEESILDILDELETPCEAIAKDIIWMYEKPAEKKLLVIGTAEKDLFVKTMQEVLSPREYLVMNLRYGIDTGKVKELTYDDIGKKLGVQRERVRQIVTKSLHKLRAPQYLRVLLPKAEAYITTVEESIPEIIPKKLDIMSEPIDILGLSNRTCNILKRNGCWTIGSTAKLTRTELSSFRGMGKNSIEEINTKMRNLFLTTKKIGGISL